MTINFVIGWSLNPIWGGGGAFQPPQGKTPVNQFQSDFLGSKSQWHFNPNCSWWFGTIFGKKNFTGGAPKAPEKFKNPDWLFG